MFLTNRRIFVKIVAKRRKMSSHHFVTEGQEPALIIANGAICSDEILGQSLEWCPFVLVLDGALQAVLDRNIAFNAVSGDFDSEPRAKEKVEHLQHVEVFHTPDQDQTDLEKGIAICQQKGFIDIHILWGTGKRTDHLISNINLITRFQNEVNLIFWDDFQKVYGIKSGFSKWYTKGTDVSLIPWPTCKSVTASNLVWPLEKLDLNIPDFLSTSNKVADDGLVKVEFEEGNLIIAESL